MKHRRTNHQNVREITPQEPGWGRSALGAAAMVIGAAILHLASGHTAVFAGYLAVAAGVLLVCLNAYGLVQSLKGQGRIDRRAKSHRPSG